MSCSCNSKPKLANPFGVGARRRLGLGDALDAMNSPKPSLDYGGKAALGDKSEASKLSGASGDSKQIGGGKQVGSGQVDSLKAKAQQEPPPGPKEEPVSYEPVGETKQVVGSPPPAPLTKAVFKEATIGPPNCMKQCQLQGGTDPSGNFEAAMKYGACVHNADPTLTAASQQIDAGDCLIAHGPNCLLSANIPVPCPTSNTTACEPPCAAGFECVSGKCVAKAAQQAATEDSNTALWVGLGLLGVAVVGVGIYAATRESEPAPVKKNPRRRAR